MNKKGQYYERPSYTTVHPVLIIGIALFILPFMLPVLGVNISPGFKNILTTASIILILIGGAMSIFNASN